MNARYNTRMDGYTIRMSYMMGLFSICPLADEAPPHERLIDELLS